MKQPRTIIKKVTYDEIESLDYYWGFFSYLQAITNIIFLLIYLTSNTQNGKDGAVLMMVVPSIAFYSWRFYKKILSNHDYKRTHNED